VIDRYTRDEMGALWSEQAKFESWLEVELAVCEVLAEQGEIPPADMATIREKAAFDIGRIDEIERTVGHDVIAFLTSVAEHVGPASRFVHYGLTSSDVVDTAQGLRTVRSADLLLQGIESLIPVLESQARRYKDTLMIGRTHGIHAEPYTLGLKFAGWYTEARRNLERLRTAREEIAVGKLSGSVGTYAHLGPDVERAVMKRLALSVESISTQVIPRDRHAAFVSALGVLASSLDRITTEIRHLQRSDVREVEEPFGAGQKGSSSMPHKRNPVKCENVSGLARIVRSYVQAALEDVPLWHERDISHSSVERVMLPDVTILCDFMMNRVRRILEGLHVYPERMQQNMGITRGLIFSQAVLLALTRAGMTREQAYEVVQDNAMRTWNGEADFRDLLAEDDRLRAVMGEDGLAECFDPRRYLEHVDTIFERVFEDAE